MAPENINPCHEPPYQEGDVEFSGPYSGDPRDPKLVGDSLEETWLELEERARQADLLAARQNLINLRNAVAAGENVNQQVLKDAEADLLAEEEKIRRYTNPND